MQAAVVPSLEEKHGYRVVWTDSWPSGGAPLAQLIHELYRALDLGGPPASAAPLDALDLAIDLADQRSERPILIYLDQLEQTLYAGRDPAELDALLEAVDHLARRPTLDLHVVLALREDYLGRFRDRARRYKRLLEHSFRLGPLTVREMTSAVCRAAQGGEPPRRWPEDAVRALMLQVRVPGQASSEDAEVQAVFGQIDAQEAPRRRDERLPHPRAAPDSPPRGLQGVLQGICGLRALARPCPLV
ncbi:hypothetical protein BE04_14905 [Sorangium cellulosum]|uniref:Novel STAND NTPase 1 domain-containing protein n=1 Tax=Sorangium cellulosum TaxID=56 RepID=A0A150PRY0_SORCE|nr:hypothetical protein BE04_14905 [Sorangium cellulosum]